MGFDRVQVDATGFENLIGAVVRGDIDAALAAVDEIAMAHDGAARAIRIVQAERKRARGIVDQMRPCAEVLPVPGLRVGSTVARPQPIEAAA
jgi:hypothetical protein